MQLYKKKPVIIEAVRCTPSNVDHVAAWCGGWVERISSSKDPSDEWVALKIPTLEDVMTANTHSGGDWVIRGVKGEFYPCKPDIFEATYEPAGEL
jgi:hypothetical protein